jgi:putative transcriptional regulator
MLTILEQLAPGFLIASPALQDPNFDGSLVLMCMHGDQGAMGLVINRLAPFTIREIMEQINIDCEVELGQQALVGGPVAMDSGLLLYRCSPDAEHREDEIVITDELRLCPGRDLLAEIGQGRGPEDFYMLLGHSGWSTGQLEKEIASGSWIPTPLNMDLIFTTPLEDRWNEALRSEGLHPGQMGTFVAQA